MFSSSGLPIHIVHQNSKWTSIEDDGRLEFSIEITSLRSQLDKDGKFKKLVIEELGEKIDLKVSVRVYVESISAIHESVRELIGDSVSSARKMIEAVHRRYAELYSGNLTGLSAMKISKGQQVASIPLLLDWDDVRVELQKRNAKMTNLNKRYVTGRIKNEK